MSNILILFILFWGVFFVFQKRNTLLIAFTATLLFIFNQLEIAAASDTNLLWLYAFMYALSLLDLLREKENK